MAHQYTVGVKEQAPLLFVIEATASSKVARVGYSEIVGRYVTEPPAASTALRPVWSRVETAGTGGTPVTPGKLNPFSPASSFRGLYAFGVDPVIGFSSQPYPIAQRNGYAQRVLYPKGSGPFVLDSCSLAVQADATGDWVWDVNVILEEL